jgi:hypothetical protein
MGAGDRTLARLAAVGGGGGGGGGAEASSAVSSRLVALDLSSGCAEAASLSAAALLQLIDAQRGVRVFRAQVGAPILEAVHFD